MKKSSKKTIASKAKASKTKKAKAVARRSQTKVILRRKITAPVSKTTTVAPPPAYAEEKPQYYSRPAPYPISQPHEENWPLPSGYGDNRIVLLARDPYWVYAYWEISRQRRELASQELGETYHKCRLILRVYDVTDIIFTGDNAHHYFDIGITDEANNWYINVGKAGRSYCLDMGLLTPDKRFIILARSNVVKTPLDRPSDVIDEEWMILPEDFQKLYALSVLGFGSSPLGIKKKLAERLKQALASGAVPSMFSPMGKKERKFHLMINTELIVYGATEANATLTVQGRPIKLNRDGTFSLRFALPDGKQIIAVKAISHDKEEERTITPVVSKETK